MDDNDDYEYLLEQSQAQDLELKALRDAKALRDRQMHQRGGTEKAGGSDDDIFMSVYRRNVARREAREAREALVKEVTAPGVAPKTRPPAPSEPSRDKTHDVIRRSSNAPCGIFLLALKKGDVTWRLQLFASELSNGEKVSYLRFQLWTPGEGGQPIKDGPGCGFSLSMKEAKAVVAALLDGIRQVESGEFDPNAKGNYLPRRRGGSR